MADKRGIYLTLDPDSQVSRGEAMLSFLSPIPQDYDPFRPDSPILHRHRSLCDLAMLAQKPIEEPKPDDRAEVFIHSIDELHSFVRPLVCIVIVYYDCNASVVSMLAID